MPPRPAGRSAYVPRPHPPPAALPPPTPDSWPPPKEEKSRGGGKVRGLDRDRMSAPAPSRLKKRIGTPRGWRASSLRGPSRDAGRVPTRGARPRRDTSERPRGGRDAVSARARARMPGASCTAGARFTDQAGYCVLQAAAVLKLAPACPTSRGAESERKREKEREREEEKRRTTTAGTRTREAPRWARGGHGFKGAFKGPPGDRPGRDSGPASLCVHPCGLWVPYHFQTTRAYTPPVEGHARLDAASAALGWRALAERCKNLVGGAALAGRAPATRPPPALAGRQRGPSRWGRRSPPHRRRIGDVG
ncbi:unnamed protein product, partial [Prorocentrum cordatum]